MTARQKVRNIGRAFMLVLLALEVYLIFGTDGGTTAHSWGTYGLPIILVFSLVALMFVDKEMEHREERKH